MCTLCNLGGSVGVVSWQLIPVGSSSTSFPVLTTSALFLTWVLMGTLPPSTSTGCKSSEHYLFLIDLVLTMLRSSVFVPYFQPSFDGSAAVKDKLAFMSLDFISVLISLVPSVLVTEI